MCLPLENPDFPGFCGFFLFVLFSVCVGGVVNLLAYVFIELLFFSFRELFSSRFLPMHDLIETIEA